MHYKVQPICILYILKKYSQLFENKYNFDLSDLVCVHPLLPSCWSQLSAENDNAESGRDNAIVSMMATVVAQPLLLIYLFLTFTFSLSQCWSRLSIHLFSYSRRLMFYNWWILFKLTCLFFCFAGIDFKIKTVELQGKKIKLQIWWVSYRCEFLFVCQCCADAENTPSLWESCFSVASFVNHYVIMKHLFDIPPLSTEICRNRKWSSVHLVCCRVIVVRTRWVIISSFFFPPTWVAPIE